MVQQTHHGSVFWLLEALLLQLFAYRQLATIAGKGQGEAALAPVAFIFCAEKSSMLRPCTISHFPPEHLTGKEKMTSCSRHRNSLSPLCTGIETPAKFQRWLGGACSRHSRMNS